MALWREVNLGEVLEVVRNGTTAPQVSERTGFPVSRIETIASGTIDWSRIGFLRASEASYLLRPGDILYSHINSVAHVGKVALYEGAAPLHHGMNLMLLRARSDRVHPRFLHAVLASTHGRAHARRECKSAINQASLSQADITGFTFLLPPLEQQDRICRILDTLDTTIRQTEAIIEKLKQVKQGLLHDLLTRGIDANGELRPPQSQAPHLYKDSPLGWIPKEWSARSLGDLSLTMTNGFVGTALPHYSEDNDAVPYLYGKNVRPNLVDIGSCTRVSARFHRQQAKSQLAPGDLLTVQSGHIGTTAVVPTWLGEANCHALIITRLAATDVVPEYIACYCNSALGLRSMSGIFVGSTIPHINVKDFKRYLIPMPRRRDEQQMICVALDLADRRVKAEDEELAKLRLMKSGLMDDLLTGRVRVTPLLVATS
ncbi:MAG: restriction endonuclease subunit S [Rubrivivax sp.]